MGYLYGKTDLDYYKGNNHGDYQFCSLDDIIEQFMVVYVGDEKLINTVSRTDVQSFTQRALAEMSFDTFKSVKAQQIDLPPSCTMILPKDYVNYTKLSWVDTAGIKHPLYPTNDTSNPFVIKQEASGSYEFAVNSELLQNNNFTNGLDDWTISPQAIVATAQGGVLTSVSVDQTAVNPQVTFQVHSRRGAVNSGIGYGYAPYIYQEVDVTGISTLSFSGNATSTAAGTQTFTADDVAASAATVSEEVAGTYVTPGSVIRLGFSTSPPSEQISLQDYDHQGVSYYEATPNSFPTYFDLGYLEWIGGDTGSKFLDVDVSSVSGNVYMVALCIVEHTDTPATVYGSPLHFDTATIDDILVSAVDPITSLTEVGPAGVSSTFSNYRAATPIENEADDYDDETYWPNAGERYGLDPTRSQVNGSFYIDDRMGKINFSSNISGKTVILDYISDSLGTDGEMKVHKFAEDAMFKWIMYSVLASKVNIPEYIVQRAKKEKFAATRQAKLRLSNIKLEEITQTLRGKTKQIKH